MYLFRLVAPLALVPDLSLLECLIFGSTLSATDPVTILAVFTQYKVDPHLYSVIFGESILNDAVSIVMYETLSKFHGIDPHVGSFLHGVGIFLLSFTISMALGVIFGLACSLALKHSHLGQFPGIESCLVTLVAYTSYFFSNGLQMSGGLSWHRFTACPESVSKHRHCLVAILWDCSQALCVLQHVQAHAKDNEIHVFSNGTTIRELYIHLSWTESVHPRCSSVQACAHFSCNGASLKCCAENAGG